MYIIRSFQPQDFHEVVEIERSVFKEHDPYLYMELYESVSDGFLVAVDDSEIIGYAVGFISIPGKGKIFTLAVKEEYRGLGIGTALMDEVCATLKNKGAKEATLEVRLHNISAQQFYIKKGFIPTWIEKGYYSDGEDALVMKKELEFS